MTQPQKMRKPASWGAFWTVLSCALWGVLPIYWKQLPDVSSELILIHRILWSALTLHVLIGIAGWQSEWMKAVRNPRTLWGFGLSGMLIGLNWYLFVFAIQRGRVLETSLGYFLSPILSVVLGAVLFREKLGRTERLAVMLGAAAVVVQSIGRLDDVPWIAIGLCSTFAFYGVIRKALHIQSIVATAVETLWLTGAVGVWFLAHLQQSSPTPGSTLGVDGFVAALVAHPVLLAFSGVITAAPLAAYAEGAKRIPLSLVGLIQYIAPALQFLVAVVLYREPMNQMRWLGFGLVCMAVMVTAIGKLRRVSAS